MYMCMCMYPNEWGQHALCADHGLFVCLRLQVSKSPPGRLPSRRDHSPTTRWAMADDGSLHLAKRVRIFGLQKAPALNGRVGTAVSYDPDAGRYAVAVDGGETVRVKPAARSFAFG